MKKRALLLAALLTAAPPALAAQEPAQPPTARIAAALEAAVEAGIPTALLESKVREGGAKGVPPARIAAAVEARLAALVRARDVLVSQGAEAESAGQLSVAADALQAGVDAEALAQVGPGAPPDRRAVAIAVLTQLVQMGYGSEQALVQVNAALRRGPDALANLPAQARAQLRARGIIQQGLEIGVGAGGPPAGIPLPGEVRGRINIGGRHRGPPGGN